jgi:hypothetical protein
MALEHVPRCQHVKVNGVQCGSPALRNQAHCFFHHRAEHERLLACEPQDGKRTFGFPLLEDANAIQVALMKVIQMLGSGTMDHKTASLMLYALQTASYNLRHTHFEPEKLTDVVIDEDTVDLTRVKGPQWAARDFPPPPPPEVDDIMRDEFGEDEVSEDEFLDDDERETPPAAPSPAAAAASTKPAASLNAPRATAGRKPAAASGDPTVAEVARRREQKRKLPQFDVEQAMEDQPDSLAAILLKRMNLPPLNAEENESGGTSS